MHDIGIVSAGEHIAGATHIGSKLIDLGERPVDRAARLLGIGSCWRCRRVTTCDINWREDSTAIWVASGLSPFPFWSFQIKRCRGALTTVNSALARR